MFPLHWMEVRLESHPEVLSTLVNTGTSPSTNGTFTAKHPRNTSP